jgi:hypothetical protein
MKKLLILALLALTGCASTAFQDLHDGQGVRGALGIPLKDTIPAGLNAAAANANMQAALANERAAYAPRNVWVHGTVTHNIYIY